MRTGHDLEGAAAHPNLEGELKVLGAPHVETRVVHFELHKVAFADREGASGHGRAFNGINLSRPPPSLRNWMPAEVQAPRETADLHGFTFDVAVFKCAVVDDVNH